MVAVVLALAGCSDDDDGNEAAPPVTSSSTTTAPARPAGPAADTSEVLDGGNGTFLATGQSTPVPDGWVEEERVAAGTATSYRAVGELPPDGRFELVEDATGEYRTRIVIARPGDAADFNGTVVVEWLNVSGGLDAGPERTLAAEELHRRGYAWVGVSAQHIGIEGGPVAVSTEAGAGIAGRGLRALDPARYESLRPPGEAFSYDIYTQVARAIRAGDVLGDLTPDRVLAAGESQSAFALTTYINGVHPLVEQFDGFLVHSRAGGYAPLGEPGAGIDVVSAIVNPPVAIRADTDVPVLVVQTETDVTMLGYLRARQDDTDHLRVWEIAGAAHADRFIAGAAADSFDCGGPINDGPNRFVIRAALRALDEWVRTGEAPPAGDRLEVDDAGAFRRDADGIVLGGVRTPPVDVPVTVLSGESRPGVSIICSLFGSSTPMPPARIAELYSSPGDYLAAYEAATDAAIDAGFLLEDDRDGILDDARPEAVTSGG